MIFEAAIAEKKLYAQKVYAVWKGWQNKYQLETFDLSFIRLSDL